MKASINQLGYLFIVGLLLSIFFIPTLSASEDRNIEKFVKGSWKGIEVMGCDYETAQVVRSLIPIKPGTPFILEEKKFKSWCEAVKRKTGKNLNCTFVGYVDSGFYFNVDFLSSSIDNKKINFLSSKFPIGAIPKNISNLYDDWKDYLSDRMIKGINSKQFYKNGYLHSNDSKLQKIAKALSKRVPRYNKVILDIIRYSPDPNDRVKAATLLSWAMHSENVSTILKENLLNDPDAQVRNELARSFSYLINDINDKQVLSQSITILCEQIKLPSHGDRTKALASLYLIFKLHPELNYSLNTQCKETLLYINEMSILPNVGGVAREILAIVEKNNENTDYN